MGLAKIIGILLLLIFIILGVAVVDIYLTATELKDADPETMVSDPSYTISDDNSTVTITVDVDIPSGGFIPKGVIIKLTLDFEGAVQTAEEELNLGDKKTLAITFTLSEAHAATLAEGGSLGVNAWAVVTPTIFGYAIEQAEQEIDLGSQSISV
ncbi:MAG: hypothetical protein ACXAD7_00755 [Candidatus Kariarchaeaceae archaeon]|jgi:hypothetical protein